MRRPCTFKKADAIRAMRAVREAGLHIVHVEIGRDGLIVIVLGQPGGAVRSDAPDQGDRASDNGNAVLANDLDRELAEFKAQHDKD